MLREDTMRLVYMGASLESSYPLEYIIKNKSSQKHEVLAVVSQPAKKAGRGQQKLIDPPLAQFAKKEGILCLQPEKASDPDFQKTLKNLHPDIIITCSYGQILNSKFLDIPTRGTINIHPSMLPKYRGATPIQSALLDGLTETGITILFTIKELDAGNLIVQEKKSIASEEVSGDLTSRLFLESGPLLVEALKTLEDSTFTGKPQNPDEVIFCKKIKKEDGLVSWESTAEKIYNTYRAYTPWPMTHTFFRGKRIVLNSLSLTDHENSTQIDPGAFSFSKKDKALYVRCQDGFLKIHTLKPEGSRILSAADFWNGLKNREDLLFSQN